MEPSLALRSVPVYRLLPYRDILKNLASFAGPIDRCNFTTRYESAISSRVLVAESGHGVDFYKSDLRGDVILEMRHIKLADVVILSEDQYKDYRTIAGLD